MADKQQIQQHLALTSGIPLNIATKLKGEDARKLRIMEHIKKSKG